MKTGLALLASMLICSAASAQYCLVRQHNGESHFYYHAAADAYTTLVQALADSDDGDTLHLPGATYTFTSDLYLTKGLVIIGTGIDPDSTGATGITRLTTTSSNGLVITNTANNIELHGIVINGGGDIDFGMSNATSNVNGVHFVHCDLYPQIWMNSASNSVQSLATNTVFKECIIRALYVKWAASTTIQNCIISSWDNGFGIINSGPGCTVENCIILGLTPANAGVEYRYNIFMLNASSLTVTELSTFENNLWVLQAGGILQWGAGVAHSDNEVAPMASTVFQTPPPLNALFGWGYDFHLVPGSQWETMGPGGTPVGIYGGGEQSAWKDGSLPFNPHWDHFWAPGATSGGVLQGVQLRGTAQSH